MKAETFEIRAVLQHAGPGEQVKARLLQRDEPGIGHRESRGALADMMEPVAVLQRPVLLQPVGLFWSGRGSASGGGSTFASGGMIFPTWSGNSAIATISAPSHPRSRRPRPWRACASGPRAGALCRRRLQPRDDPFGQSPLDEQGLDLRYAEVALLSLALAQDVQQDRPFTLHE